MAGVRRPTAILLLGALSMLAVAARPPELRAAGDGPVVVSGATLSARTFDLTGDGVREVVRLANEGSPGTVFLEALAHDAGGWQSIGRLDLDLPDLDGGRRPMRGTDPVSLLTWRVPDRVTDASLLLLGGTQRRPQGGVDRLELSTISMEGGELRATRIPDGEGPAERVDVADLDGDGTDELIVTEPVVEDVRHVRILRRSANGVDVERISMPGDPRNPEPTIGDSDGLPGDEVIFTIDDGRELVRLVAGPGGTEVEVASLERIRASAVHVVAWPMAAAKGRIYLSVHSRNLEPRLARLEWPRGGTAELSESLGPLPWGFLRTITAGSSLYLIHDRTWGLFGRGMTESAVLDAELQVVAEVVASSPVQQADGWLTDAPQLAHGVPFSGVIPGGYRGGLPAVISGGNLVTFEPGGVVVRPTSSFIGVAPVGLAGPDLGWLVLTRGLPPPDSEAHFFNPAPVEDGLLLVPAATAFEPESNGGRLSVEYRGAVPDHEPGGPVASPDGGFEILVRGAPHSRVAVVVSGLLIADETIGDDGVAVLELDPRPRRDDTVEYSATAVMLGIDGRAHSMSWRGVVIREPPELEASAATRDFAAEAIIEGRSTPHATVTVDGAAVALDGDGQFRTTVPAGPVPRDIVIRATDPVGNEATQRLEVVGFIDHRGLPWLPIAGGMTVAVGIAMFLRVPRRSPLQLAPDGEGRLEDVDGDHP